MLSTRFSVCAVQGELSGFTRAASGHSYFTLKDADGGAALMRCAMFRRAAGLVHFQPGDGQLVEVRGRVAVYEPRGELQFVVESMQRAGAGALYEQFLRAKARLEALGLFDASRKRPLPAFPRVVGVITSLGAAALHDVLAALARRASHVSVIVYPTLVQGADAPEGLCNALAEVAGRNEVDVLIVCRGGGSLEDLWAFNDERVVRAIAASPIPVVCGIGHETDVTLADLAADLRAPTPTAAAEFAAPTTQDCLSELSGRASAMQRRVRAAQDTAAQRLDRAAQRLARPGLALHQQQQRLALLGQRLASHLPGAVATHRIGLVQRAIDLRRAIGQACTAHDNRLAHLSARLTLNDPKRVLARGYAWLSLDSGQAVTSVRQLAVGDSLQVALDDGSARVEVSQLSPPLG